MDKTYEKIAIFLPFLNSCFYNLRRLFLFSEYRQTHFPGAVCAKKEDGKTLNFQPKPWTNSFGKIPVFRLF